MAFEFHAAMANVCHISSKKKKHYQAGRAVLTQKPALTQRPALTQKPALTQSLRSLPSLRSLTSLRKSTLPALLVPWCGYYFQLEVFASTVTATARDSKRPSDDEGR